MAYIDKRNNYTLPHDNVVQKLKAERPETTLPFIVLVSKNTCLRLIKRLMLPRSSAYDHLILSMVTCIPATKHRRPLPTHTIHLPFPFRRFPPPLTGSFFFFFKSHFSAGVMRNSLEGFHDFLFSFSPLAY